jgi:hypothetical protein
MGENLFLVGNDTGVSYFDGGAVEGSDQFTAARHTGYFMDIFANVAKVVGLVIAQRRYSGVAGSFGRSIHDILHQFGLCQLGCPSVT